MAAGQEDLISLRSEPVETTRNPGGSGGIPVQRAVRCAAIGLLIALWASGCVTRTWLTQGYPRSCSNADVIALLAGMQCGEVEGLQSVRLLARARKMAVVPGQGSGPHGSTIDEVVIACLVDRPRSRGQWVLLYLVRSLDPGAIPYHRVWHRGELGPESSRVVDSVTAATVAAFVPQTNFGLNECRPDLTLLHLEVCDASVISIEALAKLRPPEVEIERRLQRERSMDLEPIGGFRGASEP
jgi:hypothetical protein